MKNKLVAVQHNIIDKKTNKVIESNSKDERKLRRLQQDKQPQNNNKQQQEQQQQQEEELDNRDSNSDNNNNNGVLSYFNNIYSNLNDWLYLKNFSLFSSILQCGVIPRHIGVIMDGNRRFARRQHIDTSEGHKLGFTKMLDLCQWGLALGVQIISVYAFSIENFKRPPHEVAGLMELANEKFEQVISRSHKLQKLGVRIRIVGDISHIPEKTRIILSKAVKATESNSKALLNICMSYTSHEEMLHSMKTLSKGVQDNIIKTEDIDQNLFEKCLYVEEDLDILVRTSGEYRLSDFMLWQSCFSSTNFLSVLWPDFSCFHFFFIIFLYQYNYKLIKERQKKVICNNNNNNNIEQQLNSTDRIREFVQLIKKNEKDMFDELSNKTTDNIK